MFEIGELYELHTKIPRKNTFQRRDCTIVQICERFIVVNFGNYKDTVDFQDLKNRTKLLIKKGEKDMPKEPKITKEQLIQECHDNGIDKESLEEIAKKYNMSHITIKAYFHKWGIKEELTEKKNNGVKTTDEGPKEEIKSSAEEIDPETRYHLTEKGTAAAAVLGKSKPVLKPYVFAGRCFVYELLAENQVAITIDKENPYTFEDIESIILELQELKGYLV